jgi:hypothetical protein
MTFPQRHYLMEMSSVEVAGKQTVNSTVNPTSLTLGHNQAS